MDSFACRNLPTIDLTFQFGMCSFFCSVFNSIASILSETLYDCREETENHVFCALLKMVPDLESRLLASSEEEVRLVADLVRSHLAYYAHKLGFTTHLLRSRRASRVHDLTTPKVSKASSLIGLHLQANRSIHRSRA